ncbi:MAG: mandelate racemase/muconate lactonizing enzyme family protein [bacterium]|nr:mandelate racemase/muconate lactonizing enzyme family protein [bacterium]
MKLQSLRWMAHELTFRKPTRIGSRIAKTRTVYLLELVFDSGLTGIGEAASLAGWGNDSDDFVIRELSQCRGFIAEKQPEFFVENGVFQLRDVFSTWFPHSPSVQFALSTALIDAVAKERNQPIAKLLNPHASDSVTLSALLSGTTEQTLLAAAENAMQQGYSTIKCKSLPDSLQFLTVLKAICSCTQFSSLRIDANEQWSVSETMEIIRQTEKLPIEYIEQPLPREQKTELLALLQTSPLPIALDESIASAEDRVWWLQRFPSAVFVIKPMVIGSIDQTIEFCRKVRNAGGKIVLSSAMDSAVANAMYLQIAAAINCDTAMGIMTQSGFTSDIVSNPIPVMQGTAHIPSTLGIGVTLSPEILTQIRSR